MCPFESGQGHQSKRAPMRIEWKYPKDKIINTVDHYESRIEAWVKDYCIGWINIKWNCYQSSKKIITEITAVSALTKTRKIYATYNTPKDYDLVIEQALTNEHTILRTWIVEQWKSMLEKAGIV